MKKNLAVMLATLLLIVVTGEVLVRVLQRAQWLPDYRKGNISAQPNKVRPPKYVRSSNPVLYIEHDTSSPGINQWGTRDPDFSQEKPANVYRIAVIGDSVSFGYGVNYEDSYPYALQSLLNNKAEQTGSGKKVQIINFAVSGYGIEAYVEMYRSKVRFFQPDLVLVGYVQNDPSPANAVDTAVREMMRYKSRRLRAAKYSQLAAWMMVQWDVIRGGMESRREWAYFQQDDVLAKTLAYFQQLQQMLQEDHANAMVVIFPYLLDFPHYPLIKVHETLVAGLQAKQFPVCDVLPDFMSLPAKSLRLQDGDVVHLNTEGNRLAANSIFHCLDRRSLVATVWDGKPLSATHHD